MKNVNKMGSFLKKIRENAGYSQNDLGKLLGYQNGQFISNMENGRSLPPIMVQKILCRKFKIPFSKMKGLYMGAISAKWESIG